MMLPCGHHSHNRGLRERLRADAADAADAADVRARLRGNNETVPLRFNPTRAMLRLECRLTLTGAKRHAATQTGNFRSSRHGGDRRESGCTGGGRPAWLLRISAWVGIRARPVRCGRRGSHAAHRHRFRRGFRGSAGTPAPAPAPAYGGGGYGYAPPAVAYAPPPVYYSPPPVAYAPPAYYAPAYYPRASYYPAPRPYYAPRPVYSGGYGYGYGYGYAHSGYRGGGYYPRR